MSFSFIPSGIIGGVLPHLLFFFYENPAPAASPHPAFPPHIIYGIWGCCVRAFSPPPP